MALLRSAVRPRYAPYTPKVIQKPACRQRQSLGIPSCVNGPILEYWAIYATWNPERFRVTYMPVFESFWVYTQNEFKA